MKFLAIFAAVFFGTTLAQVEVGEEIIETLLTEIVKDLEIDIPQQVVELLKSYPDRKIRDIADEYVVATLNDLIDKVFENIKEQVENSTTNSLSLPNLSLKKLMQCLSRTQIFERFRERRETTGDDQRHGRPSTSKTDENIEKIGKLIREDHRLSIRGLAEISGIDKECVRQILHESFNMRKVCAKLVPKLLTPEQKESRTNICAVILNNTDTDPGLLDTISGGTVKLSNGLLEDIFFLKRNGDAELEYNFDENVLKLTLPIQLDDVKMHNCDL
ncbi:hypothetical protein NQ318_014363 [Aromia moschata]|uniref:Uncharacterized protein n=1 Tax=Aromia moschata TaxID=1265417 RepID=A0AAV8Z1K8_9CUCU|nr:hypothetical protein NQ318_014363 [Aromia moschata]